MKTIELIIENNQDRINVPEGTLLSDLANQYQNITTHPILGALINNQVESLQYRIFEPCCIRFLDISSKSGYRMYLTSLSFMLYRAVKDCFPQARLTVEHSLLTGFYCEIHFPDGEEHPEQLEICRQVRERMMDIVQADLKFEHHKMLLTDAIKWIEDQNIPSTKKLLEGLGQYYIEMHTIGGMPHKLANKLVPSTGKLTCWEFRTFEEGYIMQCPDPNHPERLILYQETPKLFNIFKEHHRWANLLQVPTISDLNNLIYQHKENNLIQVAEALHEKKYAQIADEIFQLKDKVKMVLLAGPSSSGKTTSCRRLSVQLSVLGFDVHQLSLDDYFLPREQTPRDENGELDFECIEALNIPLLNDHLMRLFNGEEVELPTFDFVSGTTIYKGNSLCLKNKSGRQPILLVEGIHALNPKLTAQIPNEYKFKVYVSALTQIAIDDQNFIHSSDNRLIRRIVRDNNFRGYSATDTLSRWSSVRHGEEKHIFPFQEQADAMFNSALLYELAVLRPYAAPLLNKVQENRPEYEEAQRLIKFLELIEPIYSNHIPPTSILKEFLGGSSFEY